MEPPFLTQCETSATNPEPRTESTLVCGDSSSEPVFREMRGAMNTLHEHQTSLGEDVTSLEQAGRQRDEAIHCLCDDHSKLQQTVQEKVVPRIEQLEASTSNLSSEVENIQKTITAGIPGTVANDQHAGSQKESVPPARVLETFDEHDQKAAGIVSPQSISPAIEERLSKVEELVENLRQQVDAIREDLKTRSKHDLEKDRITDLLKFVEEHRKNSMQTDVQHMPRGRTRALSRPQSIKRRIPPQFRSTPKREHLASNASTVSSGFWSTTQELPSLDDVDEANPDYMQDEDLDDDSLPPTKDPNFGDEVKNTEDAYQLVINLIKVLGTKN